MLSLPLLNTGPQMGQQLSMDEEGREVTGEFGKGENSLQLSSKMASEQHMLSMEGLRGLADEEVSQDRPCMKDKIDNLIENYLLGSDEDGLLGDEGKSTSSSSTRDKNSPITASSLLNDCANSSSTSHATSSESSLKISEANNKASESEEGKLEKCTSVETETAVKESDCNLLPSASQMEGSSVNISKQNESNTTEESKTESHPQKDSEQIKSNEKKAKNIIEPKNVTTFQTLIEKVLDTSLNNNKTNAPNMCSQLDGDRRKSAPCEDLKHEENKLEKRLESVENSRALSHDDMSISKRKLVYLKDHIEKVLEKSYYNLGKKKEDDELDEIRRPETSKEENEEKSDMVNDSSDFNAQQIVDTVNDQTKVVNCLLSPSKESSARREMNPSELKPSAEQEDTMISTQTRPSNLKIIENGRVGNSVTTVEGPKHAAMNKALLQGMARLQNHVEETVANISRSAKEFSGKEMENLREHQVPPTTYPGFIPNTARQTISVPADRSHLPVGPGSWPRMASYQGYPGNPTATTPVAVTTYLPSHSSANPGRSPKEIQNSFYSYGAGLHHSPKGARQLSPRQPSPRHPSPRHLSPAAISPICSKTSPPNLEIHQSHYSGPANTGHQISLRDCQCASCDNKHGRKGSSRDVPMSCIRTGEYSVLKPGHISSGSPYHSPNSVRPPVPSAQHHSYPPEVSKNTTLGSEKVSASSVSSAMALGPGPPPLMYHPGNPQFRMPQLYPSNPPIPSPREYNRVNTQAASVSPQSPFPQHPTSWKSPEQKMQHLSPRSAVNPYSPTSQQINVSSQAQKLPQQQQQPSPHYSPHQLTRAGKPETYWNREERHIRKEVQYPYVNEPEQPQHVSPPVLDLSIKKKMEPEQIEDSVEGDAPLDLTCRKPKVSKTDFSEHSSGSHGTQSLGSYIAGAVMDKKFAAQRNTYIHHLENSVDKYCRERKSPSAGYQRQMEGFGPHSVHSADQQGPKHLYNQTVRNQELGPSQAYIQGQARHEAAHQQMLTQKLPVSVYPGQGSYGVLPGQTVSRGAEMPQRGVSSSFEKTVQHLPPQAQQSLRHMQHPHTTAQHPHSAPQHPHSNHSPHHSLSQHQSFPSPRQPSPIPPSHHLQPSPSSQGHLQPTSSQSHSSHRHSQQPLSSQQQPQPHQAVNQPPHPPHNSQHYPPAVHHSSQQQDMGREETASPVNGDSRQLSKRANNVSKHEPIQNIIGNHSPHDILYLICRLCSQTYGSPYGFRKHFRNQHGFEPRAEHTIVQTISATKTALQTPAITPPAAYSMQAASTLQHVPQKTSHMDPPPPLLAVRPPPVMGSVVPTNIPGLEHIERRSPTFNKPIQNTSQGSPSFSNNNLKSSDAGRNNVKQETKFVASQIESDQGSLLSNEQEKLKTKSEAASGGSPIDKKFMECPECGQTFQLNDFGLYKRHCRQHGQPKLATPFVPGDNTAAYPIEQVSSSATTANGVPTSTSADMSTVCKVCNIPFATVSILDDHMNSIHPEQIKTEACNSEYEKPPPIIQVTRAPAESATLSVSPDSSCEPSSTKDVKSIEDREMPVLKKQVSSTSSVGNDLMADSKSEIKGDNDSRHSTSSPVTDINRQVSSESGSISENTEEKSCEDFTDDATVYMHKKFSSHRKRKNSISAMDAIAAKHLKYSSDLGNAKSPGSINSPSAYSSTSYDSETSNMLETQQVMESGESGEVGDMDEADMDKHSKLVLKIKCGNGNINSKSEARHQLPFVWDRVTRSQAGKNIKPPKYH